MARTRRLLLIATSVVVACKSHERSSSRAPAPPIAAIAADLEKQLGVQVVLRCEALACTATLPDATTLPITVKLVDHVYQWELAARVISTAPIAAYISDELAASGTPREVACTPRIRKLVPNDVIACLLAGGGKAFVTLGPDGGVADLEIELDPDAAKARSEELGADELSRLSRALEHADEDNDENETDEIR